MTFGAPDHAAARVAGDRDRAQGDALIELHVIADHGGLADDGAGRVIEEERPADLGAGMDVGAGLGVGPFGHDPRHHRHAELMERVGDAVDAHGQQARMPRMISSRFSAAGLPS